MTVSEQIARLARLVPPPAEPAGVGGPLSHILAPIADIPAEWRAFSLAYGTGDFCDAAEPSPQAEALWIHNPFSPHYQQMYRVFRTACAGLVASGDEHWPLAPPHPAVPGLLPLGGDTQRLDIYWLTDPDPARWTVHLEHPDADGFVPAGGSLLDFLASAFSGPLRVGEYVVDLSTKARVEFRPASAGAA